jgi:hypothetical protein
LFLPWAPLTVMFNPFANDVAYVVILPQWII